MYLKIIEMENLTKVEALSKIKDLELSCRKSIIKHGTNHFCKNRLKRIVVLKSYLKEK